MPAKLWSDQDVADQDLEMLDCGDLDELPECPECRGQPFVLGVLGRVVHLRCRFCGWTWGEERNPR